MADLSVFNIGAPKQEGRGAMQRVQDLVGDTAVMGANVLGSLGKAAIGGYQLIADPLTGGAASRMLRPVSEGLARAQEGVSSLYSEPQQAAEARFQEAQAEIDPDAPFLSRAATSAGNVLSNPLYASRLIGESSGLMLAPQAAVVARVNAARAAGASEEVLRALALRGAGVGEGSVMGASAYERSGLENPNAPYQDRWLPAVATGVAGAAIPMISGRYLGDVVDTAFTGARAGTRGAQGIMTRVPMGFASESLEEGAQSFVESGLGNVAANRPFMEGVAEDVGTGFGVGGAMGGTMALPGRIRAQKPAVPRVNQNDSVDLTAPAPPPLTGQGELGLGIDPEAAMSMQGVRNPYDTAGFVSGDGLVVDPLGGQGEMFGQVDIPAPPPAMQQTGMAPPIDFGAVPQRPAPSEAVSKLNTARSEWIAAGGTEKAWAALAGKTDLTPEGVSAALQERFKNPEAAGYAAADKAHTSLTGKPLELVAPKVPKGKQVAKAIKEKVEAPAAMPPAESKILALAYPEDGTNPMALRAIAKAVGVSKAAVEKVLNKPEHAERKNKVAQAEWTAQEEQSTGLTERNLGADAAFEETREGENVGMGTISSPGGSQVDTAAGAGFKAKRAKGVRYDSRGAYTDDELGAATEAVLEERNATKDPKVLKKLDDELVQLVKESERRETSGTARALKESNPAQALWEEKHPDIAWEDPGEGDSKFLTDRQRKNVNRLVKRFENGEIDEDRVNTEFEAIATKDPKVLKKLTAEDKVARIEAKDDAYLDDVEIAADVIEDGVWKKGREKFRDVVKSLKEDIESLKALRACIAG